MFSLLIPGRLPQLDIFQVDPNRFVFHVPSAQNLNHLVVFMTPDTPFPPGFGATLHFLWPGRDEWQLLGMLSNDKPSAIFRLRSSNPAASSSASAQSLSLVPSGFSSQPSDFVATLGILVEPLDACYAELSTLPPQQPSMDPTMVAQKVAKNLFNYLAGFGAGNSEVMQVIERWYKSFEAKVRSAGTNWLERED